MVSVIMKIVTGVAGVVASRDEDRPRQTPHRAGQVRRSEKRGPGAISMNARSARYYSNLGRGMKKKIGTTASTTKRRFPCTHVVSTTRTMALMIGPFIYPIIYMHLHLNCLDG